MIKWCFSTLGCTERSLSEIISLANKYSISAVEIRGIGGKLDNESIPEFAKSNLLLTKDVFKKAKITPLVLGTSLSFHDEGDLNKNVFATKNALNIAYNVGFDSIRVFGNSIVGEEKLCVERVASGVQEVCFAAQKVGITVLFEVHGDFNTLERIMPIVEKCGVLENFGIIWDICHTHKTYGKNWKTFYDPLAPYIRHVHLKDVKNGKHVLPGEGELPIVEIVNYMAENGYQGHFSLEWERYWRKELPEIEYALEHLLSLFK